MNKLFGTDGIRAVAGQFPLDYSSICTLGKTLMNILKNENHSGSVLIGRDTRESGNWIEQALIQGIGDAGGTPVSAGIIPTSAVAYLTKTHAFSAGIVISASHNPYEDNGIKIFSSRGIKISPEWEERLERAIHSREDVTQKQFRIQPVPDLEHDYQEFLKSRFSQAVSNKRNKVVLDCSNGASSNIAPRVLSELGFEVLTTGDAPNGKNINFDCGSLYPQCLAKKVIEAGADIGVADDGDADRALWVDENGRILNGDHTLYVLSRFMKKKGLLRSKHVVATTMSNLGLELALRDLDLELFRAQVGDKYVLEQMIKLDANLGGEQSGHTILLDECPTGDGILTSIKMLEVMVSEDKPLSALVAGFKEFPQVLLNVRVSRKDDFADYPEIMETMESIQHELGNDSRMNVRYSGTEPLARVMIEGRDQDQIESLAQRMVSVISKHLG